MSYLIRVLRTTKGKATLFTGFPERLVWKLLSGPDGDPLCTPWRAEDHLWIYPTPSGVVSPPASAYLPQGEDALASGITIGNLDAFLLLFAQHVDGEFSETQAAGGRYLPITITNWQYTAGVEPQLKARVVWRPGVCAPLEDRVLSEACTPEPGYHRSKR